MSYTSDTRKRGRDCDELDYVGYCDQSSYTSLTKKGKTEVCKPAQTSTLYGFLDGVLSGLV